MISCRNGKILPNILQLPGAQLRWFPVEHPITVKDAFTMSCGLPYCMGPAIM